MYGLKAVPRGIPHLAKNERDMGHPVLVAGSAKGKATVGFHCPVQPTLVVGYKQKGKAASGLPFN
jgi:hypothetical protein